MCYTIFANSLPNLEAKSLELRVQSWGSTIAVIAAKLFKALTYAFWLGSIPFSRISAGKIFWALPLVTWETIVFRAVAYCYIILIEISTVYLLISIFNISWVLTDDFCERKTTYLVIKPSEKHTLQMILQWRNCGLKLASDLFLAEFCRSLLS